MKQRALAAAVAFGACMAAAAVAAPARTTAVAAAQDVQAPARDITPPGGTTSVPFELVDNHVMLRVMLDGKGPYTFAFDTGASNIVDRNVADALGLRIRGRARVGGVGADTEEFAFTTVGTLAVGDATLHDQRFAVAALDTGLSTASGARIDGLIGYEVLARFVTTFDYGSGRVVLRTRPAEAPAAASRTTIPLTLRGGHPWIPCTIGTFAGSCMLDTGSRLSLTVGSAFAAAHPSLAADASADGVDGYGIGGAARGRLTRTSLTFAGFSIPAVVADVSTQTRGAFANRALAGNIGGGVLKRFAITFDYAQRTVSFVPDEAFGLRDTYDRSGLFLVVRDGAIVALDARPGTPAAQAGLSAGDAIVRIGGAAASELGLARVRALLSGEAGTAIALVVARKDGAPRSVVLTLRDYV